MYTTKERQAIQNHIISIAKTDERIIDGAIVGSEAIGNNDRWSDIDLSFGVKNIDVIVDLLRDLI